MKRMRVETLCDKCYDEDGAEVAGASTPPLVVEGRPPRTLDLCERHHKATLGPLLHLIESLGPPEVEAAAAPKARSAAKPRPPAPEWICPVCEDVIIRTTAIGHLERRHGATIERPTECPVRGCSGPATGATSPQAILNHRARVHGYSAIREAVDSVRERQGTAVAS